MSFVHFQDQYNSESEREKTKAKKCLFCFSLKTEADSLHVVAASEDCFHFRCLAEETKTVTLRYFSQQQPYD